MHFLLTISIKTYVSVNSCSHKAVSLYYKFVFPLIFGQKNFINKYLEKKFFIPFLSLDLEKNSCIFFSASIFVVKFSCWIRQIHKNERYH